MVDEVGSEQRHDQERGERAHEAAEQRSLQHRSREHGEGRQRDAEPSATEQTRGDAEHERMAKVRVAEVTAVAQRLFERRRVVGAGMHGDAHAVRDAGTHSADARGGLLAIREPRECDVVHEGIGARMQRPAHTACAAHLLRTVGANVGRTAHGRIRSLRATDGAVRRGRSQVRVRAPRRAGSRPTRCPLAPSRVVRASRTAASRP